MDLAGKTNKEKDYLASRSIAPKDLLKLAAEASPNIKVYVARNPNTPEEAMMDLLKSAEYWVREQVAKNYSSSIKVLVSLFEHEKSLKDPDDDVIKALYDNKKIPVVIKRIIETLFEDIL